MFAKINKENVHMLPTHAEICRA